MSGAALLCAKAQKCRALARACHDARLSDELVRLASEYDAEARRLASRPEAPGAR